MAFQLPPGVHPPPAASFNPPQIFGSYATDALPQLPPDLAAQMFADSHTFPYDESQDAKRRRIARACDMCRKKKIKCDGKLPSCTQCINYKAECVFTQVEKKRAPPKGAKYIEGLENRLGRMEHLLRLSGLLSEGEETDLGALEKKLEEQRNSEASRQGSLAVPSTPASPATKPPSVNTTAANSQASPADTLSPQPKDKDKDKEQQQQQQQQPQRRSSNVRTASVEDAEPEEDVENLSDLMCSLVTNQSGETRYLGSSSGFSIFSPKGIQWVNQKTGNDSFRNMISEVSEDDHKWTNWKPEVFNDVFRRPVFQPLPSKDDALSLLKDYFENFNCMFPLFHQPTFMHLVQRQYSADPYQGSGWWASLNCALAIAHRLRVMSHLVPQEEDQVSWGYLKNAMGVFTELTMRNTDLLSVQALLGMALFMQGTPNPQPSTLLVAAAIRLSHTIGLHKRGTGFNLNPIELEQRKRVFWIAYILDKDMCLRAGRPPTQDDDDMNIDLPDADPEDNIGNIPLADGKSKMNIFRTMCEFAVIESDVYRRLYSTKATKSSVGELLNAIGELDSQLEDWKDAIPIDFRPEHEIKASHTPLILHVVMLHFAYYNCLTTIHRMSVHHGFWTSRLSNYALQGLNTKALNPRVYSSAALCTAAARASISLVKYIPQGDNSCVWMILYFPVSALMTLFANILNNPLDPRAKPDIRLMNLVVNFLSMLGHEAEQGGVYRMLGVCAEFERIAKSVIEKAEKDQSSRRKRKNHHNNAENKAKAMPNGGGAGMRVPNSSNLSPVQADTTGFSPLSYGPSPNMPWNTQAPPPPPADFATYPPNGDFDGFAQQGGFPTSDSPGSNGGMQQQPMQGTGAAFPMHQPMLPTDLFQLPMNLDWDWAELSGGAYPTVENGNFGGDPMG
ncbi:putative transcriptional regulatory protein-like protein [Emericellopsis cladophorae]|uniref:Transcriptional regulatory protein-like protein n=1 Tax=Emericellopsis cladophorae TaxID=2686198 RepID=A0A9P9Y3P5_9HYPO|nr:putative transcriptional regulatory protein-like protein [Emericellopsis cladophorae]KAI6783043.1 putative transcriptional regulatory protein-like protein [Emericellopsis cladophorae]